MIVEYIIFGTYTILGLIAILFNSKIAIFFCNIGFIYTNRKPLSGLFILTIKEDDKNVMYSIARYFSIALGIIICIISIYYIYRIRFLV